MSADLQDRYGVRSRRPLAIALGVLVAVAFLAWLAWATWFHATPSVSSTLDSFEVVDGHTVTAVVSVKLEDAGDAECTVQVLAADHTTVGVHVFTPVDGRNELTIRTEREATSVELRGCTAEGQSRPR